MTFGDAVAELPEDKKVWVMINSLEWFEKNAWKNDVGNYYRSKQAYKNSRDYAIDSSSTFDDDIDYDIEYCYKPSEIVSKREIFPLKPSTIKHTWGCTVVNIEDYPEYRI